MSCFVEVPLVFMQTLPQPYLLNNALFVLCSISTKGNKANEHSVICINTCLNSPSGYQLNPHLVFVERQEKTKIVVVVNNLEYHGFNYQANYTASILSKDIPSYLPMV